MSSAASGSSPPRNIREEPVSEFDGQWTLAGFLGLFDDIPAEFRDSVIVELYEGRLRAFYDRDETEFERKQRVAYDAAQAQLRNLRERDEYEKLRKKFEGK